jgi:hypothetical protein
MEDGMLFNRQYAAERQAVTKWTVEQVEEAGTCVAISSLPSAANSA